MKTNKMPTRIILFVLTFVLATTFLNINIVKAKDQDNDDDDSKDYIYGHELTQKEIDEIKSYEPTTLNELSGIPVDVEEVSTSSNAKSRATTLPSSYDGRKYGYTTSVKDQNPFGTCWCFATTASVETSMIRAGLANKNIDLSERAMGYFTFNTVTDPLGLTNGDWIGFDQNYDQPNWYNGGANSTIAALSYLKGIYPKSEELLPYNGQVTGNNAIAYKNNKVDIDNVYYVNSADQTTLKSYIYEYGGGAFEFDYEPNYYNYSTGAYINSKNYDQSKYRDNHEVEIIGWNDYYSRNNFNNKPARDGAFICKNSWGSGWGDGGYFYISYDDAALNGTSQQPTVFYDVSNTDDELIYEYDGTNFPASRSVKSGSTIINNYKIQKSKEYFTGLSFQTYSANVSYSINLYKNASNLSNPVNTGTRINSVPYTGVTTAAGFIKINYNEHYIFNQNDVISIVISLNKNDGSSVDVGVDLTTKGIDYSNYYDGLISRNTTQANQSFLVENGQTTDLANLSQSARVKMFTIAEWTKNNDGEIKHYNSDLSFSKGWYTDDKGGTYYFDSKGYAVMGWQQINGHWYFIKENGQITTNDWYKNEEGWHYFNEKGWMLTDWQQINNDWYMFNSRGIATVNSWFRNGNGYHYFNETGKMLTGWQKVEGNWYYFNESPGAKLGVITTGWYRDDHGYHYFNEKGWLLTGWKNVAGNWYYFNETENEMLGVITTGWFRNENGYHYFNEKGWMLTGWKEVDGHWYYFNETSGQKLGVITVGWYRNENGYHYFNEKGWMLTGWQKLEGHQYYFNENKGTKLGVITTGWYRNTKGLYYFNDKGWLM